MILILNAIKDARVGDNFLIAIMLGTKLIWQRNSEIYLDIIPEYIWLTDTLLSQDVEIISNTDWVVK